MIGRFLELGKEAFVGVGKEIENKNNQQSNTKVILDVLMEVYEQIP